MSSMRSDRRNLRSVSMMVGFLCALLAAQWPGALLFRVDSAFAQTSTPIIATPDDAATGDVTTGDATTGDPTAYTPSVVVLWNEAMLAAIRNGGPRPTVTARAMFLVHQAIYDTWSLYDEIALPSVVDPALRRPASEHTLANKQAAISQVAYHTLIAVYPAYEAQSGAFSRLLEQLGYEIVTAADETPAGIGYSVAQAVLADRAADGSNAENNYADITSANYPELYQPVNSGEPNADNGLFGANFDANHWEPLRVPNGTVKDEFGNAIIDHDNPASFSTQVHLTPHWGAVRPFALASGDQFQPPAPPKSGVDAPYIDALGRRMTNDEAYNLQVDELLHISAALTDEQKVIAEYWADGPRSETPPGHWNALAHGIAYRDRDTIDDDAKLFFALNGALFDASIAAWEAKRAYDCVRPASAIRHKYMGQTIEAWGGPNEGTQLIMGEEWLPYQELTFVTPPFAEYVSGHSTFSEAAATVLTQFTGSNRFYDGETVLYNEDFNNDGLPDMLGRHVVPINGNRFEKSPSQVVVLQWETFQDGANQAGMSRRYGGIHFLDGDLRGRSMGRDIGTLAFDLASQYWSGQLVR